MGAGTSYINGKGAKNGIPTRTDIMDDQLGFEETRDHKKPFLSGAGPKSGGAGSNFMGAHHDVIDLEGVDGIGREEICLAWRVGCFAQGEGPHVAAHGIFVHNQATPTPKIGGAFGGHILHTIEVEGSP
jgi:hypothetical protein